jgi:3-oxoacyl-[acyl-carrier protein] reductase
MDFGLKGRVVIVTGSSRGIGRAAALLFAEEGASVAVTFMRDRERAETVVTEINRVGSDACAVHLDLGSTESINAAVSTVAQRWGHIDVLVNNAVHWGNRAPGNAPLFEQLPPDEWKSSLRAKYRGAVCGHPGRPAIDARAEVGTHRQCVIRCRCGRPSRRRAVRQRQSGTPRLDAHPREGTWTRGILVNVVMPGLTLTERNAARLPDAVKTDIARTSPIRRLLPPEEVVPTIVFLCSAMNTAVTGEVIRASGGIT